MLQFGSLTLDSFSNVALADVFAQGHASFTPAAFSSVSTSSGAGGFVRSAVHSGTVQSDALQHSPLKQPQPPPTQLHLAQQMMTFAAQQAAQQLQHALPLFLPALSPDPAKVAEKVNQLVIDLKLQPAVEGLIKQGFTDVMAQRAALEYSLKMGKKSVTTDQVKCWATTNGPIDWEELGRPFTVQDVIKHIDMPTAVQQVVKHLPSVPASSAELAVTFCLGDVEGAVQLLTSSPPAWPLGMFKGTDTADAQRQKGWTAEYADCMSKAMNIAHELRSFTDKLVMLHQQHLQGPTHQDAGPAQAPTAFVHPPSTTAPKLLHAEEQLSAAAPDQQPAGAAEGEGDAQQVPALQAQVKQLQAEAVALRQHKTWADSRIADLIRKACEAEKPGAEELRALREEVGRLRTEKRSATARAKECEDAMARLKDVSYREANARRDAELRVQATAAELQGVMLREAELLQQVAAAQAQVRSEQKKAAAAERERKRLADERAALDATLAERDRTIVRLTDSRASADKAVREAVAAVEAAERARVEAMQYAEAQQAGWEAKNKGLQAEVTRKAEELRVAQARIEAMQREAARRSDELRKTQAALLYTQRRVKGDANGESRLIMDTGISPDCDAGRQMELLKLELETERMRGRDDLEEAQELNSSLLLHSNRLMEQLDRLRAQLKGMGENPCV